MIFRKLP